MESCQEEGHNEELMYYCISDSKLVCSKCIEQRHSQHLCLLLTNIATNAIQSKPGIELKSGILSGYTKISKMVEERIEYKKKALNLLCEAFRNSIVKQISGSIKDDIVFNAKIKAYKEKVEATLNSPPQVSPDKRKLIEESLRNRKWQSIVEGLGDYIKHVESQEHLNVFSAELSKSEISLNFLQEFMKYMSAIEQEIYANLERKDIEFEKLLRGLSEGKVTQSADANIVIKPPEDILPIKKEKDFSIKQRRHMTKVRIAEAIKKLDDQKGQHATIKCVIHGKIVDFSNMAKVCLSK